MSDEVRASYDDAAELYASLFIGDLHGTPMAKHWLGEFAELAAGSGGRVADLGCGPGHVVEHLSGLGLDVVGYDLSPRMIEQARLAFPDADVRVGDFTALGLAAETFSGIVSRYSLIHLLPTQLQEVFVEWRRLLVPDAPLLVSFFGARSVEGHAEAFDHKVATAYALSPTTVAADLEHAGFRIVEVSSQALPAGGRPYDDAVIFARKPTD